MTAEEADAELIGIRMAPIECLGLCFQPRFKGPPSFRLLPTQDLGAHHAKSPPQRILKCCSSTECSNVIFIECTAAPCRSVRT